MLGFKNSIYRFIRMTKDNSKLLFHLVSLFTRKSTSGDTQCHFLVVKDKKYAKLSTYAIASLMYFNRDVSVIVHTDDICYRSMNWRRIMVFGGKIRIVKVLSPSQDPMYEKALLLLSLQGTHDFFLDADTRINGQIEVCSHPTVLVKEFFLEDRTDWRVILSFIVKKKGRFQMLNTSFFSWGGTNAHIELSNFKKFYEDYLSVDFQSILDLNSLQVKSYTRLVEQIFFSITLTRFHIEAIKQSDRVVDHGVIESTYYGASGYRFGR